MHRKRARSEGGSEGHSLLSQCCCVGDVLFTDVGMAGRRKCLHIQSLEGVGKMPSAQPQRRGVGRTGTVTQLLLSFL